MLSNGRNRTVVISGMFAVMLTIIAFSIITNNRTEIDWLGLGFMLVAEISLTVGLVIAGTYTGYSSSVKVKVGSCTLLIVYTIAAIIISVIFIAVPVLRTHTSLLKLIQVLIIALTAIFLLVLITSDQSAARRNHVAERSVLNMNSLINKVLILKEDPKNSAYSKDIGELYELIKFSDLSSRSDKDSEIDKKVGELESLLHSEEKCDNTKALIEQITLLVMQRSIEISSLKSGRI